MPMFDNLLLLHDDADIGHAASEYTAEVTSIDFGVTTPAANLGGKMGLHLIVTEAFTDLDSGAIMWLIHGAATSPTTKHSGLFIPVASLTLGAYFFIPAGTIALLRHIRGYFEVVSETATLGEVSVYAGPGPLQGRI